MVPAISNLTRSASKTRLERLLSLVSDVQAGEGLTTILMLVNIFVLLVCYAVIKTVREPLILLGGGAEVRSYASAGQALLLMGFVPLYGWFASRVNRTRLVVGVTLFFVACVELFSLAVAARMPYVGVAFFIWVGIFNVSLVAQFWSFANDLYSQESGDRLFPIIVVGMTAGAPLGSFVAARLFRLGFTPQVILQTSALLLVASAALYLLINRRETPVNANATRLSAAGGFSLVLGNHYLRLVALLVVLLNVVNTTGEYLVAKLLTLHVGELAAADTAFNRQAYIGAFSGEYQLWVNLTAFALQAFVASRLIKHKGLAGVLLALPLIALGGYSIIAVGAGFSLVRWIKTAENATDYSIMNTARQLLWLPTTREEKYKAKQAIDAFFVRSGDVLSAGVVALGTGVLHLSVQQFAVVNVALTLAWLAVAVLILKPSIALPRVAWMPVAFRAAAVLAMVAVAGSASAQETREEQLAASRAEKAQALHPYEPDALERRLETADRALSSERPLYLFMGGPYEGSGLAFGPGYRLKFGDSGRFNAHATWSVRNFKDAEASVRLPSVGHDRVGVTLRANWLDAPTVAFFGTGSASSEDNRSTFLYRATTVGAAARVRLFGPTAVGGSFDVAQMKASPAPGVGMPNLDPTYRKSGAFAEVDTRTSPEYSRRGGLYRVEVTDYRQTNRGLSSFRRLDAEVQQFVPLLRENWVLALRALASTTDADAGQDVPYFLMPDLGGTHMLRGFAAWRFRDRQRVLLSGEYRWTAGPLVDMALFVDAGKVASRRADLNLSNLEVSQGIGVRIHTPSATVTRVELAHSREGLSLICSFSPSF